MPFDGPDGQGPFESMNDCISEMDGEVEEPGGWCAWAYKEDTGEWPTTDTKHLVNSLHHADTAPDVEEMMPNPFEILHWLEEMEKSLFWPDYVDQKADIRWERDDDVPGFAQRLIGDAIDEGGNIPEAEKVPMREQEDFFRDKLTQAQGWSLRSLAVDFADEFDLANGYAENHVKNAVQSIIVRARVLGYIERGGERPRGDLETRNFRWAGPDDDRNEPSCEWLLDKTNPDGMPLLELLKLIERAKQMYHADEQTPDSDTKPHWGCRHTIIEVI